MFQKKYSVEQHNRGQREYYESREKNENWRMRPAATASPYIQNHIEKIIAFGNLTTDEKLLDIGCGMGKYTIPIAQKGFNIDALDLSPVLLKELQSHCGDSIHINTHCIDILNPPASFTHHYDAIIGSFMLHHLIDIGEAFHHLNPLLNKNGKVVFIDVNPFCPLYYLQITLSPSMRWKAEKGIFQLSPSNIKSQLEKSGFKNITLKKFGIAPPLIRNLKIGKHIDDIFEKLTFLNSIAAFQLIYAEKI
jgi:2-polyprenyl-3-methyl-5-hydroxy-6-metoxy-1,4-benzoquinol methylase